MDTHNSPKTVGLQRHSNGGGGIKKHKKSTHDHKCKPTLQQALVHWWELFIRVCYDCALWYTTYTIQHEI